MTFLSTDAYGDLLRESEQLLAALPLEHWARNRTFKDFVSRLQAERNALLAQPEKVSRFFLIVPPDLIPGAELMWRLQSIPERAIITFDADLANLSLSKLAIFIVNASLELPQGISDDDYLVSYGRGDFLHPGLANTLALRMAADGARPDVWTWNVTGYSLDQAGLATPTCFIRKPERPNAAWLSADVTGRALAVRVGSLRSRNLTNPLKSMLDGAIDPADWTGCLWRHHPEYLGLYESISADELVPAKGPHATRERASALISEAQWESYPHSRDQYCPAVWPRSVGKGVSVIVPFRDKALMTLETVRSVARQISSTWIELVLVNNQSRPEELDLIYESLPDIADGRIKWTVIDYPKPFNHSRQCNFGARAAAGETLVFLNNDAILQSDDVLECFARWSGVSGVITVAARILDRFGRLQCAGLRLRQRLGPEYNSPIEESNDDLLARGLKEVVGNSFACAAVRRDRFLSLKGLDEVLFPIGYNDVEFSLRSGATGWKHLYLGWLCVSHSPGSSRGGSDEMLQKIMLRDKYFESLGKAKYQLESDSELLKIAKGKVNESGRESAGAPLFEWWSRAIWAMSARK